MEFDDNVMYLCSGRLSFGLGMARGARSLEEVDDCHVVTKHGIGEHIGGRRGFRIQVEECAS